MAEVTLNATEREVFGRKLKLIRSRGEIPAVLYGRNFKNQNLSLDKKEFQKIYDEAGTSTLVNLEISGQDKKKILIHEPQRDPVHDEIVHVDLYKIDMSQEIKTEIPLKVVGSSKAVEELEGNLIMGKDALEIECLPEDLISEIEVDISQLKTFDDLIKVSDLKIPEKIKVQAEPEEIIAQVTPPRSEEELEKMESEAAAESEKTQIETMEAQAEKEKEEKAQAETEEGEAADEANQNKAEK